MFGSQERLTAHIYQRVFDSTPAAVRRAPGGLTLLDGGTSGPALAIGIPWGAVVAAGPSPDGMVGLHSMNHYTEPCLIHPTASAREIPPWAARPVAALAAHGDPPPAVRLVVNNELPAHLGLLTGAETFQAACLALRDVLGPANAASDCLHPTPAYLATCHARQGAALLVTDRGVEFLPCDLATAGLRLLLIDVGVPGPPARADAVGGEAAEKAALELRAGNVMALGPLLTAAHIPGDPVLDAALEAAFDGGALGGLAVGRCGVALVPASSVPKARAAVTARLKAIPGRPRNRPPRFLTAAPAGARPLRGTQNRWVVRSWA